MEQELRGALKACRRHIVTAAAFSLAINVLHLAAPLYMMQVYDRVMASSSGMTLALLTAMVLVAYGALAGLERARSKVLAAASARLDRLLAGRTFAAMMGSVDRGGGLQQQGLRDLDQCRQMLGGSGVAAMFDVPWIPIYVLITFALHWAIGLFTLACAALLIVLAVASELALRASAHDAQQRNAATYAWSEATLRNADAVKAMAMMPGLIRRWAQSRGEAVQCQRRVGVRTASLSALVRFLRLSMQSLVLGLGAWLVIEHAVSAGAIFAGSLLLGRALQPVEQVIGQWQALIAVRSALVRLSTLLAAQPHEPAMPLIGPPVRHRLTVEGASLVVAGRSAPIVTGLDFSVAPGESVGLIGPSGAGKSTLARLLVGAAVPSSGSIALGGVDVRLAVAPSGVAPIGYMPQEPGLFDDTIAANISRFRLDSEDELVRAARIAGAHEMIMGLPDGYSTRIGTAGAVLSGGMRQRIALARAVYGNPSLIVLDEPSANLDRAGDAALASCIRHVTRHGAIVIVVSHRPVTAALMSRFLVLIEGRQVAFGTRQEIAHVLGHGQDVTAERLAPRGRSNAKPEIEVAEMAKGAQ